MRETETRARGAYVERFQSENVFFSCCPQSAYSYNSLADFYTDANNYLANRSRTTSPITLAQFQVRYSNIPGNDKAIGRVMNHIARRGVDVITESTKRVHVSGHLPGLRGHGHYGPVTSVR